MPESLLLKKRLWHKCFPLNFAKFLRAPFSQKTSGRLDIFRIYFQDISTYSPFQHIQDIFSMVILLNLKMIFTARKKQVKIARISLEVMAEKLKVSST